MSKLRPTLLALTALFVGACGHDICDPATPCPNDPRTSEAATQSCRDREAMSGSDPCRAQAHTLANCAYGAVVCTSGGRTDPLPTFNALTQRCVEEGNASARCCAEHPSSIYCGGSSP